MLRKTCVGMKWFRSHIKQGSRLALFALAIQFMLSLGHFHAIAALASPAIQSSPTLSNLSDVNGLAAMVTVGGSTARLNLSGVRLSKHPDSVSLYFRYDPQPTRKCHSSDPGQDAR